MNAVNAIAAIALVSLGAWQSRAAEVTLEASLRHLRCGNHREWSDFPEAAEASHLAVRFRAARNDSPFTLRLRQQDVKQVWNIRLNDDVLGRLVQDENDQLAYYVVPSRLLRDGDNVFAIEPTSEVSDDIRIGEVTLIDRPVEEILNEAQVELNIVDATDAGHAANCPSRITIVTGQGILAPVGAVADDDDSAVRSGVIYSGSGRVVFGLPAGAFIIYVGRGFEYSVERVQFQAGHGDVVRKTLEIRREVRTPGYVSCDSHIHTLTYSGHGDATVAERVLSIAGEGIELPVATEHNRQVDYGPMAEAAGVRRYFTPIVGNEVTTPVGHFNIFPTISGNATPLHDTTDGETILRDIAAKAPAPFIVLNHPCDLHRGYRPFDPTRHVAPAGVNDDIWLTQTNGIEVINSGAQQSDMRRPFTAWFGMLNHGVFLTPLGASDSHDVSRYIVGQARTYVRCPDDEAGRIDLARAVESLREGRVLVSCGLLAEIVVNDRFGPGDLVPNSQTLDVHVRVLGPSWTTAEQITLYANGIPVKQAKITDGNRPGVKWEDRWSLPRFEHDVHLVAIAEGPPVDAPFWPIAKPYQPTSEHCERHVMGATGAVWVDADEDGRRTSAHAYAAALWESSGHRVTDYTRALHQYDESVSIQAAALLTRQGISLFDSEVQRAVQNSGEQVASGFHKYIDAWREGQMLKAMAP